jgi:hypothetical protein
MIIEHRNPALQCLVTVDSYAVLYIDKKDLLVNENS